MATVIWKGSTITLRNAADDDDIAIGEIISASGLDGSVSAIATSTVASTADESRPGLADYGQFNLTVNTDYDDLGQAELMSIWAAQESREFTITFPEATINTLTFTAFVVSFPISARVNDIYKSSISLRVTGAPAWTAV